MAELKKSLGFWTIVALSITSIMGTGMFFGTAIAARHSGNLSIVAWLLLSVLSVYIAACFAELTAMFPKAGGIYEFAKQAYGRFFSFLIGWITWLVGNLTSSLMIVAMMNYFSASLEASTGFSFSMPVKIVLSVAIIVALNLVAAKGIEASSKTLMFFAAITLAVILSVVFASYKLISFENFKPLIDKSLIFSVSGIKNIFFAAIISVFISLFYILETYFGWESASFLAEETKEPEKVIPKALMITTIVTSFIGISVAFVFLASVPYTKLMALSEPFDYLARLLFGSKAALLISFGVVLTLIGSAASGIVSSPRLLLALARDKLFINSLAKVSDKTRTPVNAIIFQTIVSSFVIVIAFAAYEKLLSMLVPLAIFMYLAVILAIPVLRRKRKSHDRPFKALFGNWLPYFIALFFLTVIVFWLYYDPSAWKTFKLILSFVFFALPIYLLLMFHYDPDVVVKLNDVFAYLSLLFERLLLPKKIGRSIFRHLGDIEGKTILEFGCGVGTLTKELAKKAGEKGFVYATAISYSQLRIAKKRAEKLGFNNIVFIHDIHQVNRVHSAITKADAIVSVGMLGYIQDIKKVLSEMAAIAPNHAKVFFVDYVDIFKLLPNVGWLSDSESLKKAFYDAGFSVKVEKLKGLFWNYLFVYGFKSEEKVPFV